MTDLTLDKIRSIVGSGANSANIESVLVALEKYGNVADLLPAHRFAHYFAQVAHESGRFKYDQELWGPTAAQKRYENRSDLGHSSTIPGEAFKFRGRSGIQLTGRYNYRQFTKWVRENVTSTAPDFEKNPDLINKDPWEGLVPIWYWTFGNPTGKSLNIYADRNDIEMITKRINGGLNGYQDRINLYVRTALVLLGYTMRKGVIGEFQVDYALTVDDIAGPETRGALHLRLLELGRISLEDQPVLPPVIPPTPPTEPDPDDPISPDEEPPVEEEEPVEEPPVVIPPQRTPQTAYQMMAILIVIILIGLGVAYFDEIGNAVKSWFGL